MFLKELLCVGQQKIYHTNKNVDCVVARQIKLVEELPVQINYKPFLDYSSVIHKGGV